MQGGKKKNDSVREKPSIESTNSGNDMDLLCLLSSPPIEDPLPMVDSPNNVLSDSEFNALFIKHYDVEQSTPEFSGVSALLPDSHSLSKFHLGGTTLSSISTPSLFPLNSPWSGGQPSGIFI